MKRRKRAKNTENTWTLVSNGKAKVVPFIEHRWKTNLKWSHRGSIEKGKAREILYREGCAQSFSRFLILDQRWRARGRSAPRTRMVGLDPRCMLSLLLPNSILELQVFPRYSPSSSYAYGWNFGNENFLTDLELYPQGSPTRTMDPNVLRRNHKRACNDLARTDALLNSVRRSLSYFIEIS